MMDLISNAGGFINAINKTFLIIVGFVCSTNINSQLMYLIFLKKANYKNTITEHKENIVEIQKASFQTRDLLWRTLCCGSKCSKKLFCQDKKFNKLS